MPLLFFFNIHIHDFDCFQGCGGPIAPSTAATDDEILSLVVSLGPANRPEVQAQAAEKLMDLMSSNDNEISSRIADAGAIAPLVRLLGSSSSEVQEEAAGALSNLAVNEDNQVKIAFGGAMTADQRQILWDASAILF